MSNYYPDGADLTVQPMSHQEEKALFKAARAGDESAKETVIRNHLAFTASLGRAFAKGRLPDDDVVSAANHALMLAFENFNPKYPNRFAAYLRSHIRGAIARLWNEKNLVQKSDFSDGPVSTCEILEDDIVEEHPVEEEEHHAFLLELLEKAKHVLDEREAKIFSMLYSEERNTLTSVGAKLKLTRERIRQIHDEALQKLRAELRKQMNENNVNQ